MADGSPGLAFSTLHTNSARTRTFCNQERAVCLSTDLEWIPIPGGTFSMGNDDISQSPFHQAAPWAPAHAVSVRDFEMLRTEITTAQYRDCVAAGACTAPRDLGDSRSSYLRAGFEHHPVNYVNWLQADAYCTFIGGRLPTEAEWEYADSNGGLGDYSWNFGGDKSPFDCNHAVIRTGNRGYGCERDSTWEVCSKPLGNTSHGLCDMTGNLAEWTADDFIWYDENKDGVVDTPVDGSAYRSPTHPDPVPGVAKGGSYIDSVAVAGTLITDEVARWQREGYGVTYWSYTLGFRCARDARKNVDAAP
jgi:formylglycine-generating enzyme required for sulfatase activity